MTLIHDVVPCEHVLGVIDGDNQCVYCRICEKIITKLEYVQIECETLDAE